MHGALYNGDKTKGRRIVVADVPVGQAPVRNVLREHATLVNASTLDAAVELAADVDTIVCGIHFDESRIFDLLRLCRASPASRETTVVCFRDLESELAPALFQSLEIACKALRAAAFIDLFSLKKRSASRRPIRRFGRSFSGCDVCHAPQARKAGSDTESVVVGLPCDCPWGYPDASARRNGWLTGSIHPIRE